MAEVIAVALHGQTIHTHHNIFLFILIPAVICSIGTGNFQNTICNKVFSCPITLNNCPDQVLWHIGVICQQLFGVFWQTVSAVSKARVIVMSADTWIQADTVDDLLCVQSLHLSISIQLIKIAHTQSKISIGKQLNSLSLCKSHNERIYVFLDCALLQKLCKGVCCLYQTGILHIRAHNDTARIQVIIQCLALT